MKLYIVGTGATGRVIAGFSHPSWNAELVHDLPEAGDFFVTIGVGYHHGGMNRVRKSMFLEAVSRGHQLISHWEGDGYVDVGAGSVILEGTVLHPGRRIFDNCFIASNCVIGHDVVIHSHAWINSGVMLDGGAVVGERCVIGAGAVIGKGVELGEATLVGPGAVVLRSTTPRSVILAPQSEVQRFSSEVFGMMSDDIRRV